MTPDQINRIRLAIVEHKASIGFAEVPDADVLAIAHLIYESLLLVCDRIASAALAGDPVAVAQARALAWFPAAGLHPAPARVLN